MTNHEIQTNLSFGIIPDKVKKKADQLEDIPNRVAHWDHDYNKCGGSVTPHDLLLVEALAIIEEVLGVSLSNCTIKTSYVKVLQLAFATAFYISHRNKLGFPISDFEEIFTPEGMIKATTSQSHLKGDLDTYSIHYSFFMHGEQG